MPKFFMYSLVFTLAVSSFAHAQVRAPRDVKQQRGYGTYERMKRERAGYSTPQTVGPVIGAPRAYDRVIPSNTAPVYVRRYYYPVGPVQQQPMIAAPNTGAVEHRVARPIQPEAAPSSATPVAPQLPACPPAQK